MITLAESGVARDRHVVLVGQGPSSWFPRGGKPLGFEDLAFALLVTCNRRWTDTNLIRRVDLAAATDVRMVRELVEVRNAPHWIAVPEEHLQTIRLADGVVAAKPTALLHLPQISGGSCTGTTVFRSLVEGGARSVTLIGFDGTAHTGNFYAGRPGYEVGPSRATFERWESQMAADSRLHPTVEVHHVRVRSETRSALADVATTHEVEEGGAGWRWVHRIVDGLSYPERRSSRAPAS